MKGIRIIALLIMISLCLSACGNKVTTYHNTVTYYYRTVDVQYGEMDGVVVAESRETDIAPDDYEQLVSAYLNGPRESNHISPYPAGIYLVRLIMGADRVYITLSSHMGMLSGSDLMIACACLTKTVLGITGVHSMEISSEKTLLNDQSYLVFTESDFAYMDMYAQSIS